MQMRGVEEKGPVALVLPPIFPAGESFRLLLLLLQPETGERASGGVEGQLPRKATDYRCNLATSHPQFSQDSPHHFAEKEKGGRKQKKTRRKQSVFADRDRF